MADIGSDVIEDDVDVVMCTRNRDASIGAAVASVMANDHPSFRLTIIDQSTTDATERVIAPMAEADPRIIYKHTTEAGLSRAYNTGIRSTKSDVLAFTDDDCIVPTDWIRTIVAAFRAEPDGDLLYGQVIPYDAHEQGLTPFLTISKPEKLSLDTGFRIFGMGANYAARRRLFTKVGFFDEVLGGGGALRSSQDFDLEYRAYKGGAVILLRPEVTLRHDGRREAEDWPTLLLNYGTGDGAFYMKHVRCRDLKATWLLTKVLVMSGARASIKPIIKKDKSNIPYFKGVIAGMRGSFKFKVDRTHRLYIKPADSI